MKHRFTIQMKVTLWFTALMVLLAGVSLAFLFYVGDQTAQQDTRRQMTAMVQAAWPELEFEDGQLRIDADLEYFKNGVYLSVYDASGIPLYGAVPREFDNSAVFTDGHLRTVNDAQGKWYIYDAQGNVDGYGTIWVRSVAAAGQVNTTILTLLRLALVVLPFFVLLAAVGGYVLAKRALRPVRFITQTAREISRGNDLSRRIALGEGKDEIYTLANEFDLMFARLEQAFETEKQFTSDASHELRTPVAVIISQCEYALANAKTLPEARTALETVLDQAEKMAGLISQLLTLARTDQNHKKLNLELVNISELASMVAEQMQESADARSMTVRTNIQPGLTLQGDETMLMRMLINLMENAVKYGREGGWVSLTLWESEHSVHGSVRDDGPGITPEHLPLVWKRFWQADEARGDGAGLGLPMVKWIVQAHGGEVDVHSAPGQGAEFTFTLPLSGPRI